MRNCGQRVWKLNSRSHHRIGPVLDIVKPSVVSCLSRPSHGTLGGRRLKPSAMDLDVEGISCLCGWVDVCVGGCGGVEVGLECVCGE